jgi:hypothetical protein
MADEKKPKERKKPKEQAPPPVVAEPAPARPQTKSTRTPKLRKKDKSRLPRREKKAQQKAAAGRRQLDKC